MAPVCHRHAACQRRKADEARAQASLLQRRPRVFLEEWDEPLISGIGSVSDLIAIAGGDLPGVGEGLIGEGADRDPEQVVERWPDIIIGSGCGSDSSRRRFREHAGSVETERIDEQIADDRQQDGDQRAGDGDAGIQRPLEDLEQQVLLGDVAGHPERTATETLV